MLTVIRLFFLCSLYARLAEKSLELRYQRAAYVRSFFALVQLAVELHEGFHFAGRKPEQTAYFFVLIIGVDLDVQHVFLLFFFFAFSGNKQADLPV